MWLPPISLRHERIVQGRLPSPADAEVDELDDAELVRGDEAREGQDERAGAAKCERPDAEHDRQARAASGTRTTPAMCSRAATTENTLNVDPACNCAWVAAL